jgi:hypothetical protein
MTSGAKEQDQDVAEALCTLEELLRELIRLPARDGRYPASLARTARDALLRWCRHHPDWDRQP